MIPITQEFKELDKLPYPGFVKKLQEVCISAGVEKWSWCRRTHNGEPLWLTMQFKDELGFGAGKMEWYFSHFTVKNEAFINAFSSFGETSKAYARHFQKHLTKCGVPNRRTKFEKCEGVAIPFDYVLECK